MSRRPSRFTKTEVRRAIEAAQSLGADFTVDILSNGTIRISPAHPDGQEKQEKEERLVF